MLIQMPLWGFVIYTIFALIGVWSIAKVIYDNSKED